MKIIKQSDWEKVYKPEMDRDMPLDIGYDDPRIVSHPLHIWTQLDIQCECEPECEGEAFGECPSLDEPWIFSGAYWVNRMAYYFCEVPFKLNADIGVK
jgi:hypothetical protein